MRIARGGTVSIANTLSVTGLTTATGGVNAAAAYQRSGYTGYLFMPLCVSALTDTGAAVWSGISKNTGTYDFDTQASANGTVPTGAKAVFLAISAQWTAANGGYYILARKKGSSDYGLVARSQNGNTNSDAYGIVELDASGDFSVIIGGANATSCVVRLIGYFM